MGHERKDVVTAEGRKLEAPSTQSLGPSARIWFYFNVALEGWLNNKIPTFIPYSLLGGVQGEKKSKVLEQISGNLRCALPKPAPNIQWEHSILMRRILGLQH